MLISIEWLQILSDNIKPVAMHYLQSLNDTEETDDRSDDSSQGKYLANLTYHKRKQYENQRLWWNNRKLVDGLITDHKVGIINITNHKDNNMKITDYTSILALLFTVTLALLFTVILALLFTVILALFNVILALLFTVILALLFTVI